MVKIKRSLCIILSALMVVTSLDLSGFTSISAEAAEINEIEYDLASCEDSIYESAYEDISGNDVSSNDNGEMDVSDNDVPGNAENIEDVSSNDTNSNLRDDEMDVTSEQDISGNDNNSTDKIIEEWFEEVDISDIVLQSGGLLASSDEFNEYSYYSLRGYENYEELPHYEATIQQWDAAKDTIYDAMYLMKESVDIRSYSIPVTDVRKLFSEVLNENPELFYISGSFSFSAGNGETISNINIRYENKENVVQMRGNLEKAVASFKDGIAPEWSDFEKVLYINSFIDQSCEYDPSYYKSELTANPRRYNAYGALVDNVAVCQGYALAVKLLCNEIGLNCSIITSDNINHAWNLIEIDGEVYHLDTTWNDPTPDINGRARHQFFLKSNALFNKQKNSTLTGHVNGINDWVTYSGWDWNDATSTKYDLNSILNDSDSGFVYLGDHQWYSINSSNGLFKTVFDSDTYSFSSVETIDNTISSYALGIALYKSKIYYADKSKVYCYDINTNNSHVYWNINEAFDDSAFLQGITAIGNNLKCTYSPNISYTSASLCTLSKCFLDGTPQVISFDANTTNYCITYENREYIYGEEYGEFPNVDSADKAFLGWYTEKIGGVKIDVSDLMLFEEETTLYAHWDFKYQTQIPNFSHAGEVEKGTKVTIGCATNGAKIYISTDGNDPVIEDENLYTGEIIINEAVTIKAIAVKTGYKFSEVETISFTIKDESGNWGSLGDGTNDDDLDFIKNQIVSIRDDLDDISQVTANDLPKELWVAGVKDYDFTGKAVTQTDMRVYWGTTKLVLNTDYTVKYVNNVKAGVATVTVTGKGNYAGVINVDYNINTLDLTSDDAHCSDIKLSFNNKVQKGVPIVTYDIHEVVNGETIVRTVTLKNGTDYTVEYPCTNAKDKTTYDANAFKAANSDEYYPDGYAIKITGKGNYKETLVIHEFIYANSVNMSSLTYTIKPTTFNGGEECVPGAGSVVKKSKVALTQDTFKKAASAAEAQALLEAADADTEYSIIVYFENNIEIGTGKVTFVGIPAKGYAGSITKTFAINGTKLSTVSFAADLTKAYAWEEDPVNKFYDGTSVDGTKYIGPAIIASGDEFSSLYVLKNKVRIKNLKGIYETEYAAILAEGTEEEKAALRAYDYTYKLVGDYRNVGSVTIEFTGVNGYTGTVKKVYKITGKSIAKYGVRGLVASYPFTGEAIEPGTDDALGTVEVYIPKTRTAPEVVLEKGRDYEISYVKNVNVGTATLTITGKNAYTGTIKKTFKIAATKLNGGTISVNGSFDTGKVLLGEFTYTKGGVKPSGLPRITAFDTVTDLVIVDSARLVPDAANPGTYAPYVLVQGVDYTLKYANNNAINGGTDPKKMPTVTITGKGNYAGSLSRTFLIKKTDFADKECAAVATTNEVVFNNKAGACNPVITVTDQWGTKLAAGVDYVAPTVANGSIYYVKDCTVKQIVNRKTVSVVRREGEKVEKVDIVPVGAELKAVIAPVNKVNCCYTGQIEVSYRISAANINSAVVTIKPQTYMGKDGEAEKAVLLSKSDITVKVGKTVLNKTDYEIVGYKNNYKKGTAQVTLRGIGNYGGTKVANFTITAKNMNYTIVYDTNNLFYETNHPYAAKATGAMKDSVMGSKGKLAKVAFRRANYTFVGWNTKADGTGASYTNVEAFKVKEGMTLYGTKITLYAQWKANDFKITYGLNLGTNDASNPLTYNIEDEEIVLADPTREGAEFLGWYLDAKLTKPAPKNAEGKVSIAAHSTGAKAFYAKWRVYTYTVKFDKNSDEATGTMTNMVNKQCGVKFALAANKFVRKGYILKGWYTEPEYEPDENGEYTGTWYKNSQQVINMSLVDKDEITLYAQWELATYKITYVNGVVGQNGVTKNESATTYTVYDEVKFDEKPVRGTYIFDGWYKNSSFTAKITGIPKGSTGNITIYAKWVAPNSPEYVEKHIWNYLMVNIGNEYGVAGLMGNLFAESGLRSNNLQDTYNTSLKMTDEEYTQRVYDGSYTNFANDSAGYGLAQWTYSSRKANLLAFARSRGTSVGDLDTQLEFLMSELKNNYSGVYNKLVNANSVQEASNSVLINFERPKDQSEYAQSKRSGLGLSFYEKFETTCNQPVLYCVKVTTALNVRSGPGTGYSRIAQIQTNRPGPYEIINQQAGEGSEKGWAQLKTGGWISLDHCDIQ